MQDGDDVVVVGGGSAGLSGALALGRARRSVLVVDGGEPRNAPAAAMHNYVGRVGRDGAAVDVPVELLLDGEQPQRVITDLRAQVITAAAAGLGAGAMINADLIAEDTGRAVEARRAEPFSATAERELCEQVLADRRHGM